MLLVYVNKVYITEDCISKLEIIIHDEINLKNIYYVDEYNEVVEHCRKLKSEGAMVYPLTGDRFIIDSSVEKVKISPNTNIECGFKEESFIDTVYGLYSTLARNGSVLLSDDYPYENGYKGLLSKFNNIKISSKNMEVSIPLFHGYKEVGEFTLISQKGEVVLNNRFKVAVPEEKVKNVYKYNLSELGEITLNNKKFIVLEYLKDLTIFRDLELPNVSAPIIIRYLKQQRHLNQLSSLMRNLMLQLNVGVFNEPNSSKISFSDIFNSYSGVFFRFDNSIPKNDFDKLMGMITTIGPTLMCKPDLDSKLLMRAIKTTLDDNGLSKEYFSAVLVIFNIYRFSSSNIELLNSLMLNYNLLKVNLIDVDLYLYAIRLDIYNNCKVLYPGKSFIELESYGTKVGMEVWRK